MTAIGVPFYGFVHAPVTVTVTRRFWSRPTGLSVPSALVFGATGSFAPMPRMESCLAGMPLFTIQSRTDSARWRERARLACSLPLLSV